MQPEGSRCYPGRQAQFVPRGGCWRLLKHDAEALHRRLTGPSSVRGMFITFPPYSNISARSDPFIVLVLSLSFIASIFFLHISAKIIRAFTK